MKNAPEKVPRRPNRQGIVPVAPVVPGARPAACPGRTVYYLDLVDQPRSRDWPTAPVEVRLRRLLKVLLRSFGFLCRRLSAVGNYKWSPAKPHGGDGPLP